MDKQTITAAFKTEQEIAYDVIREGIVTGEIAPEQKLFFFTLARHLGMSEIPIREALKKLESERLVIRNGQSFRVAAISVEETVELLSVRLELEEMAIRRAVQYVDSEVLKDLERQLLEMEETIKRKDISGFGRLSKEFHYSIYEHCKVDVLIKAIHEAWNQTERARYVFRIVPGRVEDAAKEHYKIVEALREQDKKRAEEALVYNLKQSADLFIQQLVTRNGEHK